MTPYARTIFANNEYYHLFNRGADRRRIFNSVYDYQKAMLTLQYYQHSKLPIRLSQFLLTNYEQRVHLMTDINNSEKLVEIIAFCLMPNHFHLILRQNINNGISKFMSQFSNSYTKYFNLKNEHQGKIFQGVFKDVRIESDGQLLHLSRYIHLNPVVSNIIKAEKIKEYRWSSMSEYANNAAENDLCNKQIILDQFKSRGAYLKFIVDYVDMARDIHKIKHLCLEE